MKRSDMIDKLGHFMDDYFGSEIPGTHDWLAGQILIFLENEGMPPPFCSEIYYKVWRDGGTGYQWEKE